MHISIGEPTFNISYYKESFFLSIMKKFNKFATSFNTNKNMIKKVLLILFSIFLGSIGLFAQKINYNKKNSLMSIDKVDVAKLEISKDANDHQVYTFYDLKSDATLVLTGATPGKQPEYYIVSSTLSDRKSEMLFEMVSFTLNPTNAIMNLVVKKYQFFTTSGMNQKAITDFLYIEKRTQSDAIEKAENTAQQMQLKVDSLAPIFEGNKVTSKSTGELLAIFENINNGFLIKDARNNVVGKAEKDVIGAGPIKTTSYILNTFDNKQYKLKVEEVETAKISAIGCLITYDYLGKGVNSYIVKKPQLDAIEKQNSQLNLAFRQGKSVQGILTLDDGETIEGNFEIDFRAVLPDGTEYPLDDIGIMAPYQKTAEHHYLDKNNKIKKRDYSERQMRSFQVTDSNNPDHEEFYCRIEYKPEQSGGMGLTKGLLGMGGILKSPDKIKILAYRVIDLPKVTLYAGNQRLFIVDKRKDEIAIELQPNTYQDQLKLITADCPTLEEKAETCEYTRASIAQLMKEYHDCK